MNRVRRLVASTIFAILFAAMPAALAQPAFPGLPDIDFSDPQFRQVELTEDAVRNAVDAMVEMERAYGADAPVLTDPDALERFLTESSPDATIRGYGFADNVEWHRTVMSIFITYTLAVKGSMDDFDQTVEQLRNAPHLPEETRKQLLDMFTAMRPSDNNVRAVTAVVADPAYADKIAGILDE